MATTPTSRQDGQLMTLTFYYEEENETKVHKKGWLPFTILPHFNGQTYTIGDCMDPDEQGEYIFLSSRQLNKLPFPWKGPSLCQIICLEGKYWVRPLGGNSLFINNVEMKSAGPGREQIIELQFGDYLHFEKVVKRGWLQRMLEWGNSNRVESFWFKERGFIPDWEEVGKRKLEPQKRPVLEKVDPERSESQTESSNSDYECTVMNNTLLMSHILSYLPLKDLKNTARVSHFWNQETNHVLAKRSIFLKLGPSRFSSNNNMTDSLLLFRFWDEMRNSNFLPAWNISIPPLGKTVGLLGYTKRQGRREEKWMSDLDRILGCGHTLRKLILDGSHKTRISFEVVMKILHQFQSTLQDLTLGCGCDRDYTNGILLEYVPIPETLNFRRLQRFAYKDKNDETWMSIEFVVGLVKAVSGIRSLSLTCGQTAGWIFLENIQTFGNLEEFSVEGLKQAPNIMNHLDLLQNLRNPLTKLELLECLEVEGQGDVTVLQDLLHKQAKTLKVLRICVPCCVNTEVVIQFPVFPNLTHLEVNWHYDPFSRAEIITPATLTFGDLSKKGIQYLRDFPALQCLTLEGHREYAEFTKSDDEGNYDISETFFPVPSQIVKTLQKLEMYSSQRYDTTIFKPDPDLALRLSEMFPNVHNEWMNEVREKAVAIFKTDGWMKIPSE